jgi:hypothetical protein
MARNPTNPQDRVLDLATQVRAAERGGNTDPALPDDYLAALPAADPVTWVESARDTIRTLTKIRKRVEETRDKAAVSAAERDRHPVSVVVAHMGTARNAFVKARTRVHDRYPKGVPRVRNPLPVIDACRERLTHLDDLLDRLGRSRKAGCQAMADDGFRNYEIADAAGVTSAAVSQMNLHRPLAELKSAQQYPRAIAAARARGDDKYAEQAEAKYREMGYA